MNRSKSTLAFSMMTAFALAGFGVFGCDRQDRDRDEGRTARPVRDQPLDTAPIPDEPAKQRGPGQGPGTVECNTNDTATKCTSQQFCLFPLASCGEGAAGGICTDKPATCLEVVEPVCGCDGLTYGNECKAWLAGTSVKSHGECKNNQKDKPEPTGPDKETD